MQTNDLMPRIEVKKRFRHKLILHLQEVSRSIALFKALYQIESLNEWIPVTERLPDSGNQVLVYSPNRTEGSMKPIGVGIYLNGLWMDLPLKGGFFKELEPTHWQPFPLPPSP